MDLLDPSDHSVSRSSKGRSTPPVLELHLPQAVQALPIGSVVPSQGKDCFPATGPVEDEPAPLAKLMGKHAEGLTRFTVKEESEAPSQSLHCD